MNESTVNDYPQLRLLNFAWTFGQRLFVPFSPGLFILHGRTQTERTIILRLIRYAMGGTAGRIDEKVMQASEEVEVSFTANGEHIRAIRSCRQPTAAFQVVDSIQGYQYTSTDMSRYLIDKLGLPRISMSRTKRDGKTYEVPLSFNDLARAIVVDRDISYASILSEVMPEPRREIVKVIMGLTTRDIAQAENTIRNLETKCSQLRQKIAAIKSFLADLKVPDLLEIAGDRRLLTGKIGEMDSQEDTLRRQVRAQTAANTVRVEDSTPYLDLREEFITKRQALEAHQGELLNIAQQQREKSELRAVLEAEARRISRHLASQHVISTYSFSQCPRCLQSVDQHMQSRENEGLCMLCGRPFQIEAPDIKAWEKALRDVNQAINEVNELLEYYQQRKDELQSIVPALEHDLGWLEQQISRQTNEYVSPIVELVSLRFAERTAIERKLSELDYQERQRLYADYLEAQALPQTLQELDEVRMELGALRQELGADSVRYQAFLTHFRHFMRSVRLVHPFQSADWDKKEQLPIINEQAYKKAVTGPDLAIAVLAFHYALLAMSVSEPQVKTNHPKLLIIDEPEQQKMGKERYQQVMRLFGELAVQHESQIQIVIATDTADIPSEFEHYAYEI